MSGWPFVGGLSFQSTSSSSSSSSSSSLSSDVPTPNDDNTQIPDTLDDDGTCVDGMGESVNLGKIVHDAFHGVFSDRKTKGDKKANNVNKRNIPVQFHCLSELDKIFTPAPKARSRKTKEAIDRLTSTRTNTNNVHSKEEVDSDAEGSDEEEEKESSDRVIKPLGHRMFGIPSNKTSSTKRGRSRSSSDSDDAESQSPSSKRRKRKARKQTSSQRYAEYSNTKCKDLEKAFRWFRLERRKCCSEPPDNYNHFNSLNKAIYDILNACIQYDKACIKKTKERERQKKPEIHMDPFELTIAQKHSLEYSLVLYEAMRKNKSQTTHKPLTQTAQADPICKASYSALKKIINKLKK